MQDAAEIWKQALPSIMQGITGRGVWAALNAVQPIAYEDDVLVIGIPHVDSELAGHLRLPATKRIMEIAVSKVLGKNTAVRLIDGTHASDYELAKRRDVERRRLQEAEMVKMRAEMAAKSSWETIYEQLSRRFAAVSNKSLPQNRARFYEEAVALIADVRRSQESFDDLGERNFARCLERLAQYSEVPSTLVASDVLRRAGEL
ncbi:MAG: hypothetical protein P4L46_22215 [Fimbriimonas sp.]|nr:hypothetical protein [Fimbriimonas sp.]